MARKLGFDQLDGRDDNDEHRGVGFIDIQYCDKGYILLLREPFDKSLAGLNSAGGNVCNNE